MHIDCLSPQACFCSIIYLNSQKDLSKNEDFKTCEM